MTLLLSFLFLLSRVLHLLFCFPEPFTEELHRGTIAKELIEGLKIPFFDYAADHYSGGSLVYGALTVPSFLVFGKSVFALRLTGILFQYGAFITWFLLMKRFFGRRAAFFTALLYLFSPPWLTLYSMYAMGVHAESLFFTALGLFLLFRILYDKTSLLKHAAYLGLVTGFGTYFSYQEAVSVVCFLLFWFYEDQKCLRKKEFYFFFLFFLVGFSPWFIYNGLHHFQGLTRVHEAFTYSSWERLLIIPFRFLKLATWKVLGMLSFNYREGARYHPHPTLLNLVYYGAILFSYGMLYRFERKNRKTHFFFLFPLLFLLIASVSRFNISTYESRYFVPLFPIFFAAIALGLCRLGTGSRFFRRLSFFVLLFLLGMGVKGELNLLSTRELKISLNHQGYSYRQLGGALIYRYPEDLEQVQKLGKNVEVGLSGPERCFFHLGLCELYYEVNRPEDLKKYIPWIKTFNKTYQPFYFKEMGRMWGFSFSEEVLSERIDYVTTFLEKEDQPYVIEELIASLHHSAMKPDRMLEYALEQMRKLSRQNQKALAFAIGKLPWRRSVEASFIDRIKHYRAIERRLNPRLLPIYYRGVGALMVQLYEPLLGEWPKPVMKEVGKMASTWKEAIFWGAGFEAPLLFEDPYEYKSMAEAIPPKQRRAFEQGLSDRFAWGGRNKWIEEGL